jgi:hypothetical protein
MGVCTDKNHCKPFKAYFAIGLFYALRFRERIVIFNPVADSYSPNKRGATTRRQGHFTMGNQKKSRVFTLEQFQKFVTSGGFKSEQDIDTQDRTHREEEYNKPVYFTFGCAWVEHKKECVTIRFNEGWSFDDYQPETFDHSTEGLEVIWELEGATIVDEDDDEIEISDLSDLLIENDFEVINYDSLKEGIDETNDIDSDTDSKEAEGMERYTLENDNAPNVRFTGEILATASSRRVTNDGGRWTNLKLFKTKGGKYVCFTEGVTCWQGENNRYQTEVCETLDAVVDHFGHGRLAKEIYEEAEIDAAVDID